MDIQYGLVPDVFKLHASNHNFSLRVEKPNLEIQRDVVVNA